MDSNTTSSGENDVAVTLPFGLVSSIFRDLVLSVHTRLEEVRMRSVEYSVSEFNSGLSDNRVFIILFYARAA